MMGRKFTDDEIVKALEICSKNNVTRNNELTYKGMPLRFLFEDALDLINRQKAEIERLKVELKAMRGAANSYKAEVERLREAYALYEETTGLKWARAEAIKEFAERLKEGYAPSGDFGDPLVLTVTAKWIDNLVKEMTGEHNG